MKCPKCGHPYRFPFQRRGERRQRVLDVLRTAGTMGSKDLAYAVYGDDYHPDDANVKLRGLIKGMMDAGIRIERVTGLGRKGNGYRLL